MLSGLGVERNVFGAGVLGGRCLLYLHPVGKDTFCLVGNFGGGVLVYVLSIVGLYVRK